MGDRNTEQVCLALKNQIQEHLRKVENGALEHLSEESLAQVRRALKEAEGRTCDQVLILRQLDLAVQTRT